MCPLYISAQRLIAATLVCMIKISILLHNANTFNFDLLPFLSQLRKEGVIYLFGKAKSMMIESKIKIGHDSIFNVFQASFKSAHLLDKMALVQSQRNMIIYFPCIKAVLLLIEGT